MHKRLVVLFTCLVTIAGCLQYGPTLPVTTLPPQPARLSERPGGVGDIDSIRYVIHISVDGLRPDAVTRQSARNLPAFARLRTEGLSTQNARTDVDYRITLPNHTAQLTGRPVLGEDGHGWTINQDPAQGVTLHSNRGHYIASVFDVAHDAGMRTGAFVSKSKFSLFNDSYNETNGAPDETGEDNGRDKIDFYLHEDDTQALVRRFMSAMQAEPFEYAFIHIRDPDATGHWRRWSVRAGSPYMLAVRRADTEIGQIMDMIESSPFLVGRTALIVTADHGGTGHGHEAEQVEHYRVPFYIWGPGIPSANLYDLNPGSREDPGTANVGFDAPIQPIRNGDAANLALSLLGLGPVPGSTIGADVPLRVQATVRPN